MGLSVSTTDFKSKISTFRDTCHACKNGHLDCVEEILRHSEGLVVRRDIVGVEFSRRLGVL